MPDIQLRQRITIQRSIEERDPESGQLIPTWSDLGTYWAEVRPLGGQEKVIATQLRADITHKVTMRYVRSDLTAKDRLLYRGRILAIASVINTEERRYALELLVAEVTTGQTS